MTDDSNRIAAILAAPDAFYRAPEDVMRDLTLSFQQRLDVLYCWEKIESSSPTPPVDGEPSRLAQIQFAIEWMESQRPDAGPSEDMPVEDGEQ